MLVIANWKMYLSTLDELSFIDANMDELVSLGTDCDIIICPSFLSLSMINVMLQEAEAPVSLGAQHCSPYSLGAHTGQLAAISLAQAGCEYGIVGHHEQRAQGDTDEEIIQQIRQMIANEITPILCIGESAQNASLEKELMQQLKPLLPVLPGDYLIVVYEPTWARAAGSVPPRAHLEQAQAIIDRIIPEEVPYQLVYGGNVTADNIDEIMKDGLFDGVMVGKASTDFQTLKKIVLS